MSAHYEKGFFFGRFPFPVREQNVLEHHENVRRAFFNGADKKHFYKESLKKTVLSNVSVETKETIEKCTYFSKAIRLISQKKIAYKGHENIEKMTTATDDALPCILAEYKHLDLIMKTREDFTLNIFRQFAFTRNWMDFLKATACLFLQVILISLTLKDKLSSDSPLVAFSVERGVILAGLIFYLLIGLKFDDIRDTIGFFGIWNVAVWMDLIVNVLLVFITIFAQVVIMLYAESVFDMVTNSAALLFILQIDDDLISLSEEELKDYVCEYVSEIIWRTVDAHLEKRDSLDFLDTKVSKYFMCHKGWGSFDHLHPYDEQKTVLAHYARGLLKCIESKGDFGSRRTGSQSSLTSETAGETQDITNGNFYLCAETDREWNEECIGRFRDKPLEGAPHILQLKGKIQVYATFNLGVFYDASFIVDYKEDTDDSRVEISTSSSTQTAFPKELEAKML